jgi:putative ABC transport system permease protein
MTTYWHSVRENLRLALDTLRTHKFRSFLTVLGVLLGTTTVILVASLIQGLDKQLEDVAASIGNRTITVFKLPAFDFNPTREERLRKPLTYEDGIAVQLECADVDEVGVEIINWVPPAPPFVTARYKGQEITNLEMVGWTPNDSSIINLDLGDGRLFTDAENLHRRDVVVIGDEVRKRFFRYEDPIGKSIVIDGHVFEVMGAFARRKEMLGNTQGDTIAVVPYLTFRKYYPAVRDNILLVRALPDRMAEAQDEIKGVLRRRRQVKPADPDNFALTTADSVVKQFQEIIGMVALVMIVLSSIGLLVGGIGVMNIMLVSVTERTREIGVRKAIGARRSDITWQFLLEAMTLTGAGGLIGISIGWLFSFIIRSLFPGMPTTVPVWSIIAGFVVSVSVGLFFGMWPAMKASRLDPIVALRYE